MSCTYCKVVNKVCFWGELTKYKPWKRAFLFFASPIMVFVIPVLLYMARDHSDQWILWALGIPLLILGALGLLVSINGFNRCVVHLFGDGGI